MRFVFVTFIAAFLSQLSAQSPDGLTASEWQSIRDSVSSDQRQVQQVELGVCEAVTTDGLAAKFDNDGLSLRGFASDTLAGDGELRMNLQRLNGTDVLHGGATADGERVVLDRGSFTEWFHNTESGLMHGFTVPAAPDASQRLEFDLLLDGGLEPQLLTGGRSMVLKRNGQAVVGYRGLTVWDARGRILGASLGLTGSGLRIRVDTTDAVYPVTVDPLIIGEQQRLIASDAATSDRFGRSVAISGDTIVVGANLDDHSTFTLAGSAYVFTRSGTTWTQQQKLTASDAASTDYFGFSVAISGDTVVVGAYQDDHSTFTDAGSAYVFTRSGTTWSQQQKLTASDAASTDQFGLSVAISGDTVLVGAFWDDHSTFTLAGSAYVYTRSGTTWTQQQKLTASDAASADQFGSSAAISGDTVVVGAYADDHSTFADAGSAYVFTRSGATWTQQQKLTASDAASGDQFGSSVAISGDTVVVGASLDDHSTFTDAGSAYVYTRSGTTWTQQQKLTSSDAATDDYFGIFFAISGDTVVVGAHADDHSTFADAGSAYVYVLFEPADDFYAMIDVGVLAVPASQGVLANDGIPSGGPTSASIQTFQNPSAQGGTVSLASDGSFTYTVPANFVGTDTFTYGLSVNGSTVLDTRTVTIFVLASSGGSGGGGGGGDESKCSTDTGNRPGFMLLIGLLSVVALSIRVRGSKA